MSIINGQLRAFPFRFLRSTYNRKLDVVRWIETEAAFVGTPMAPRGTMLAALCLVLFQSLRRRFKTIFSSNEQQFCTDLAAPLLLQYQIVAVLLLMKLDTGLRLAGAMYLDWVLDYGDGAVQYDCSTWHNREDFVKKKTPRKATRECLTAVCTTRQFWYGAWRSEARIHPGLPALGTRKGAWCKRCRFERCGVKVGWCKGCLVSKASGVKGVWCKRCLV